MIGGKTCKKKCVFSLEILRERHPPAQEGARQQGLWVGMNRCMFRGALWSSSALTHVPLHLPKAQQTPPAQVTEQLAGVQAMGEGLPRAPRLSPCAPDLCQEAAGRYRNGSSEQSNIAV